MNPTVKTILIWVLILVAALGLWNVVEHGRTSAPMLTLTDFLSKVDSGSVAEVKITGSSLTGRLRPSNEVFRSTILPDYAAVYDKLIKAKVQVTVVPADQQSWFAALTLWVAPMLIVFGLGWLCGAWFQRQRLQRPMATA